MNKRFLIPFLICSIFAFSNEEEKQKIKIGTSLHMKVDVDEENGEYLRGIESCFKEAEESNKYSFAPSHIFYENNSTTSRDIDNSKKLIFIDNVIALMGYSNPEGVGEAINLSSEQDKKTGLFFPNLSYSEKDHRAEGLFHLRPPVEKELEKMAKKVEEEKDKKVVILFEKDSIWQKDIFLGYVKDKNRLISEEIYEATPLKLNKNILSLMKSKPDIVVCLGYSHAIISFIKRAMVTSLKDVKFILPLYILGSDLIKDLKLYQPNLFACKIFPNLDSEDSVVKDYIRYSNKYNPEHRIGISGLEGFISARILLDFINSLKEEDRVNEGVYRSAKKHDFSKSINLRVEKIEWKED